MLNPSAPSPDTPTRPPIPSLAQLALKYGTINRRQLKQINEEIQEKKSNSVPAVFDEILISKKMATPYQVNLLQLIREFLLIKRKSVQFGQIAVRKGYATDEEVKLALIHQQQLFRNSKVQKMLGDLLVEFGIITEEQRQIVAKEQESLESIPIEPAPSDVPTKAEENGYPPPEATDADSPRTVPTNESALPDDEISFSEVEKEFIRIKALDTDFALRVLEKRFASVDAVESAMSAQNDMFDKFRKLYLLGDIMVSKGMLTEGQKTSILQEQKRLDENSPFISPVENHAPHQKKKTALLDADELFSASSKASNPSRSSSPSVQPDPSKHGKNIEVILSPSRMEAWIRLPDDIFTPPSEDDEANDDGIMQTGMANRDENLTFPVSNSPLNHGSRHSDANVPLLPIITPDEIRGVLEKKGILRTESCSNAIIQCYLDGKETFFPAALGSYEFSSAPSYQFDINESDAPQSIKRNKTIAYLDDRQVILHMFDVTGKRVQHVPVSGNRAILRHGKGVTLSDDADRLLSAKTGFPAFSIEKKCYLFPVINVLGDADAQYGPIAPYSNISIAGTLTGAYKVTAGEVKAGEIRGCTLETLGNISAELGIIDCTIKTQGTVRAKYIQNCRIEAFGDVRPEFELLDSTIIISGRCHGPFSRIIASRISATQGITAAGIGSDVTEPCKLQVGREDHILIQSDEITRKIQAQRKRLDDLQEKKKSLEKKSKKLFNKMVDLKRLHDRAQKKAGQINKQIENGSLPEGVESREKTLNLIEGLKERMDSAIASLRKYNHQKKQLDNHIEKMKGSIKPLSLRVREATFFLELDRKRFFQWAEGRPAMPEVTVSGRIGQGTIISSQYASITLDDDFRNVQFSEVMEEKDQKEYHIHMTQL